MIRLPTISAQKVLKALKRGGFVEQKQRGSHLYLKHPVNGARTCVPLHSGDLKRSLFKDILQQAGLSEDDFRKLL